MRDKENGGQFHFISEFPFTFTCMYIILEGLLWLNGWCETWLKLDKTFFTVCWFFISSLCEDRGGCCGATSQNSRVVAHAHYVPLGIWKPINHFELHPLSLQRAYFLETSERVMRLSLSVHMMVRSLWVAEQVTANLAHVHTKADNISKCIFFFWSSILH